MTNLALRRKYHYILEQIKYQRRTHILDGKYAWELVDTSATGNMFLLNRLAIETGRRTQYMADTTDADYYSLRPRKDYPVEYDPFRYDYPR